MRPSGRCDALVVTGDSVGPIRIGASLDVVRATCPVVGDTTVQPSPNAPRERLVTVMLGSDTAVLTVNRGRVWEMLLVGGRSRTADSVGTGTTLRRLLASGRVKGYGVGGRLLLADSSRCGMTFGIAGRYPALPDGRKDSATIAAAVPMDAVVDRIRIDGCDRDGDDDAPRPLNDSTFDIVTDTVFLARDIDGRPGTEYVIRENRPLRGRQGMLTYRVAVYFDSIPATRTPAWAMPWDDEMGAELDVGDVVALPAGGSLVVLGGSYADYTSEMLLVVRDGTVSVEATHGEDYGNGFLDVTTQSGKVVVDASLAHLEVHGKAVGPELECGAGQWPAVRMTYDEPARRFVPERPRCVKAR